MDFRTGTVKRFERVQGCFELEFEVVPYEKAKALLNNSGFRGRPLVA